MYLLRFFHGSLAQIGCDQQRGVDSLQRYQFSVEQLVSVSFLEMAFIRVAYSLGAEVITVEELMTLLDSPYIFIRSYCAGFRTRRLYHLHHTHLLIEYIMVG